MSKLAGDLVVIFLKRYYSAEFEINVDSFFRKSRNNTGYNIVNILVYA